MTISNTELAQAVNRVADIVEESTKRYGIYRNGRARIHPRVVLNAMFDLAPETYFENGSGMEKWRDRFRESRKDGTRAHHLELHDAVWDTFTEQLPGDWRRGGTYYTPEQIRDIARSLTKE